CGGSRLRRVQPGRTVGALLRLGWGHRPVGPAASARLARGAQSMRMARASQLVLWAALTVSTGCASTPRYLHNRGADLVDIVQLHAVASIGADAKLEVTRFVGVGGGAYDGYAVGFANRRLGAWRERVYDFGVPRFGMNLHAE